MEGNSQDMQSDKRQKHDLEDVVDLCGNGEIDEPRLCTRYRHDRQYRIEGPVGDMAQQL